MKRIDKLNDAWCKYRGKCTTDDLNVLKFALQWCDEHPHWISVEDELPKIEEVDCEWVGSDDVLALLWNGEMSVGRYERDNHNGECYWVLYNVDKDHQVTHWMPLPQLPSGDKTSPIEKGGDQ